MKLKKILPVLVGLAAIVSHAQTLSTQAQAGASIEQDTSGFSSSPVYFTNVNVNSFSDSWGLTHSTPYPPQTVQLDQSGASYQVSDLFSAPSFSSSPGNIPSTFINANAFEYNDGVYSFSEFGIQAGNGSYDRNDVAPLSLTLTGGAFDQTVIDFAFDQTFIPDIPALSAEMLGKLDDALSNPFLTFAFPDFVVPEGVQDPVRFMELYDITAGAFVVPGVSLDPTVNDYSLPSHFLTGSHDYGFSIYDSFFQDDIQYEAGTFVIFTPKTVPEAANSLACLLPVLGCVAFAGFRRRTGVSARA